MGKEMMNMQSYYVEYKFRATNRDGNAFLPTDDYHKNKKHVIVKAKDIDSLRVHLANDIFKVWTGTSDVFKMTNGVPDYSRHLGQFYHYKDEYVWFIRDTKTGWAVNPKTGRRY